MARPTKEQIAAREKAEAERFSKAVKEGLADAKAEIRAAIEQDVISQLAAARAEGGILLPQNHDPDVREASQPATPDGNRAFASALALEIANLSAQGTGKQEFVPPEVLEARANARGRMMQLLVKARMDGASDRNKIPTYRVMKACYFNSTKIEPQWHDPLSKSMKDTEIYWDEVPNQDLEPTNDAAVQVFSEFLNSIGESPAPKKESAVQWVRSENRLFKGMTADQRASVYGSSTDIRIEGKGAPTTGKREFILGNITAPAVVR